MIDCTHAKTRNLYDQLPPSEGRKFVPGAKKCKECGRLFHLDGRSGSKAMRKEDGG